MKKHAYLNSSDHQLRPILRELAGFFAPPNYSIADYKKLHEYEFGYLETESVNLHFLIGHIPNERCPWCNTMPDLKIISPADINPYTPTPFCAGQMYYECPKCLSRGPVLNLSRTPDDKEATDMAKDMAWQRYRKRLPWDHNLQNGMTPKLEGVNPGNKPLNEE